MLLFGIISYHMGINLSHRFELDMRDADLPI